MVVFDNPSLREQAVVLWREAFGDSEEYIRFFHNTHSSCVCLTLEEKGALASALYLIDGELCSQKGLYLFAAATFKKHRGKGLMAKLLQKAEEYARQNAKSFIALVPAEASLFDYYSRFGYKTAFYADKRSIGSEFSADGVNMFCWSAGHIGYIIKEQEKYGTRLYECGAVTFSVYEGGYIKTPADKSEENRYGMLLPLSSEANRLVELNSYIGLTLE
ncbi:MAG: GNAT family N-acetyltransferase [Clostridia bacterium]|nr:GNAT family N-acetyltransferase [Clostridia bacterium]